MFLISCVKPLPNIPDDVLAELQSDSSQMFSVYEEVNWSMAKDFDIYTQNLKAGDTVMIYIYSNGGEVDAAENIINRMSSFRTICVADKAISAAFEIYQHCTVRIYMDRTLLMTHHHSMVFTQNNIETVPNLFMESFNAYIQEIGLLSRCAARMKMTLNELNAKIAKNNGEWYIYRGDIVKYNAADYHIKYYQLVKKKK